MTDKTTTTTPGKTATDLLQNLSPSSRPKDAARILGIGLSTLWKWQKEREDFRARVRVRKLGARTTVFDTAELIAYRDSLMTQ